MGWNKKRVVVTGAGGFLGSRLCEVLVSKGADVRAVDNFSVGDSAALEAVSDKLKIINCDITHGEEISKHINGADVVFHMAAIANPRTCKKDFDLAFAVNVTGTKNVLQASKNCKRVIFMSSASVYGNPDYVPIDENHPLNGNDPYGVTKIMGEFLCRSFYENHGLPVTIVRNFNAFGPKQSTDYIIPTLITQALNEGKIEIWSSKPSRDFTYIDNTINALLKIAESQDMVGEIVNVGSGNEIQIGDLVAKMSGMLSNTPVVDLKKDVVGSSRLVCNNSKLKSTGWEPQVSFEEGLEKTIKGYKDSIGKT